MKRGQFFIILVSIFIILLFLPNKSHAEQIEIQTDEEEVNVTEQVPPSEELDTTEQSNEFVQDEVDGNDDQIIADDATESSENTISENHDNEAIFDGDEVTDNEETAPLDKEIDEESHDESISEDEEDVITDTRKEKEAEKPSQTEETATVQRVHTTLITKPTAAKVNHHQQGDRHDIITDMKKKLNKIGFGGITVTNYFGSFTTKRVKEFQKEYGLKQTGTLDSNTMNKINEISNSPLQEGKRHNSLLDLKHKLNYLGFGKITVTDYFGSFSTKKVKQYQKSNLLPVSGIIDSKTENHIHNLFTKTYQQTGRNDQIKNLKEKLNKIGFGGITVTNYYGSFTTTRVKQFQEYYGLTATGDADLTTLKKVDTVANSPLQQGKRNKATLTLKNKLNKIGFGGISVTNLYGSFTEKRVKDFQSYYNLKVTGIADEKTLTIVDEIYNSPLQTGKRHKDLINLKHKLNHLGFGHITVTSYYGSYSAKKVKEFQKSHALPVSGIIDLNTRNHIEADFTSTYQEGGRNDKLKDLKQSLNNIGFGGILVTNYYGNFTTTRVKQFQQYYGLTATGNADLTTLNKINEVTNSPFQTGKKHNQTLSLKEDLNRLGFGNISVTTLYGSFTEKKVKDFQKYYGLKVNGIADSVTKAKINELIKSPLQLGKSNSKLTSLKAKLNELGYGKITVTTYFGDFTEKKVKDFQRDNGLAVSGMIDEITEKAIQDAQVKKYKIFIDAGHGGKDPGAIGFGLDEKDLTLDIAKRLGKYLSNYTEFEIKYTRTTDIFLELAERSQMANDWGADLFVSVHTNSCCGATGFESYIHDGKQGTQDAKDKQNIIHDQIVQDVNIGRDRGKKASNFHVLRETNMSAILFEYLFISTESDNDKLKQASYRDQLAKATAKGIAKALQILK